MRNGGNLDPQDKRIGGTAGAGQDRSGRQDKKAGEYPRQRIHLSLHQEAVHTRLKLSRRMILSHTNFTAYV